MTNTSAVSRRALHVCCLCVLVYAAHVLSSCNTELPVTEEILNLTSPGYPAGYDRPLECWWRLIAGHNDVVHVDVGDVDLDPYPTTRSDRHRVLLFDGYDDRTPMLADLDVTATSFTSTGRYLFVQFVASRLGSEGEHRGFLLHYSAKRANLSNCEYNLTATTKIQHLSSPGYPGGYANNLNCSWVIRAENIYTDYVVRIEVLGSELESNCFYDNVSVYDGPTTRARPLGVWCADESPVFEGSAHSLLLLMRTDSSGTKRGFQLRFYVINEGTIKDTCAKNLMTSTSGQIISSPGHPKRYPSNLYCWWRITTPDDDLSKVRLVVLNSNIESSYGCLADSVRVYDGRDNTSRQIGTFCGGQTPTYESRGRMMFVEFRTNIDINDSGFRLMYTETRSCTPGHTDELFADSKYRNLESPNYPQYYPNNFECQWRISTNSSQYVELIALTFQLERTDGCSYDYLDVRDGYSKKDRLLGRYCGLSKPKVYSTGPHMFLHFKSDGSHKFAGFRLQYRATHTKLAGDSNVVYLTTVMTSTTSILVFVAITLVLVFCIVKLRQKHRARLRSRVPAEPPRGETRPPSSYPLQESELFHIEPTPFVVSPPPYHLVVSDTRYGLPLDDPPPYPAAEFDLGKDYSNAGAVKTPGCETERTRVRDSNVPEQVSPGLGDTGAGNQAADNRVIMTSSNEHIVTSSDTDAGMLAATSPGAVSALSRYTSPAPSAPPMDSNSRQSRDTAPRDTDEIPSSVPHGCIETSV